VAAKRGSSKGSTTESVSSLTRAREACALPDPGVSRFAGTTTGKGRISFARVLWAGAGRSRRILL